MQVGSYDNVRSYSVHDELVIANSAFFEAALKKGWLEAEQRIVKLPEDDPKTFDLFYWFLYTGKIFSERDCLDKTREGTDEEKNRLGAAWTLGEKLQFSDLKDAVIDILIQRLNVSIPTSWHKMVYATAPASSPMKGLVVDIAVWLWRPEVFAKQVASPETAQFYIDVAAALAGRLRDEPVAAPFAIPSCHYHEHIANGGPCYISKFGY